MFNFILMLSDVTCQFFKSAGILGSVEGFVCVFLALFAFLTCCSGTDCVVGLSVWRLGVDHGPDCRASGNTGFLLWELSVSQDVPMALGCLSPHGPPWGGILLFTWSSEPSGTVPGCHPLHVRPWPQHLLWLCAVAGRGHPTPSCGHWPSALWHGQAATTRFLTYRVLYKSNVASPPCPALFYEHLCIL